MIVVQPHPMILMKVGFHGAEDLENILCRKLQEIRNCGVCYWGYGGTLCHPTKAVQPFVSSLGAQEREIDVFFAVTTSPYRSSALDASSFSADGISWSPLPPHVRVSASRYALVLKSICVFESTLDLAQYEVAIGPSMGKNLAAYFRGRVDKAIARPSKQEGSTPQLVPVALRASLVAPYATLVRP